MAHSCDMIIVGFYNDLSKFVFVQWMDNSWTGFCRDSGAESDSDKLGYYKHISWIYQLTHMEICKLSIYPSERNPSRNEC